MARPPYAEIPIAENLEPLVSLADYPFVAVPVYYANGWADTPDMYLRRSLAGKLLQLQEKWLAPKGLRWLVYDAWRSRETQVRIYAHYWRHLSAQNPELSLDELRTLVNTYVAPPLSASAPPNHSSGGAVDLGLWDVNSDCVVSFGSDFDEFVPQCENAYYEQEGRSAVLRQRRRDIAVWLIEQGIVSDPNEYFHKDYGNQKWAAQAGGPFAFYGEVLDCQKKANGSVASTYCLAESELQRESRLHALAQQLELPHPATAPAALPCTELLVRNVVGFADVPF